MTRDDDFSSFSDADDAWRELIRDFEAQWKRFLENSATSEQRPRPRAYLDLVAEANRASLARKLLEIEYAYRAQLGEASEQADFETELARLLGIVAASSENGVDSGAGTKIFDTESLSHEGLVSLTDRNFSSDTVRDAKGGQRNTSSADAGDERAPRTIGRYRVDARIDSGNFGVVYRAYDPRLERSVAVKVPHRHRVLNPDHAEQFLREARIVAGLDHPHIVPVYDADKLDDGTCYIVSKWIAGNNLASLMKGRRFAHPEAVEIVWKLTLALQVAEREGITHRDIKPANILLDSAGEPYLADFGLALRDTDPGDAVRQGLTPSYASPEQARGEGHLVDGRSDIFSLGIVLYELLTGVRPFQGGTVSEVLAQIKYETPVAPRRLDRSISSELERICLRALEKQANNRYASAAEFAADLHFALSGMTRVATTRDDSDVVRQPPSSEAVGAEPSASAGSHLSRSRQRYETAIMPRGLRSFDRHDSSFFLRLLPGPFDRDGLPQSIRFWKSRVEQTDASETFRVGLLYGPSGCGKSSFVQAGLLPGIGDHVISVFVEATAERTEQRLIAAIRKHLPGVSPDQPLSKVLADIRRGQGLPHGKKLLIVIDQFEQWLHGSVNASGRELTEALRQCDGGTVQCILMVRDDFWMAVTRFMRSLEIRLTEGDNTAAVDLFEMEHAKRVLAMYGIAYSRLDEDPEKWTDDQREFLQRSIEGIARNDKVVCVRIALLAEMLKGKPWSVATLAEVGGTRGLGTAFLEETFSSTTAPPEHRFHRRAARQLLAALLPEKGTEIKGHMRSRDDLMLKTPYAGRPEEFDRLLELLDRDLRLITPTDPDGLGDNADDDSRPEPTTGKYYQLTHDYLVPAIRDWLYREDVLTAPGRARLRLLERSTLWTERSENRYLPTFWEHLRIRLLTDRTTWTSGQQRMMRRALRLHGTRLAALLIAVTLLVGGLYQARRQNKRGELVARLAAADSTQVPAIVREMAPYRTWVEPELRAIVQRDAQADPESQPMLHARLALVQHDSSHVDPLLETLLATPRMSRVPIILQMLENYRDQIVPQLWEELRKPGADDQRVFRSLLTLAHFAPAAGNWTSDDFKRMADSFVALEPTEQTIALELIHDVSGRVDDALYEIYTDQNKSKQERVAVAEALGRIFADDPQQLAWLAVNSNSDQYGSIRNVLGKLTDPSVDETLLNVAQAKPMARLADERVSRGKQRATAAITLLHRDNPQGVIEAMRFRDDPESMSQFIFQCRLREVTSSQLLKAFDHAIALQQQASPEMRSEYETVIAGIIMTIGQEEWKNDLPATDRNRLATQLVDWFADHPKLGFRNAAGWVLHQSGLANQQWQESSRKPIPFDPTGQRDWFVKSIAVRDADDSPNPSDTQPISFTFAVLKPQQYIVGGTLDEPIDRRRRVVLSHPVAVSAHEVTWSQWVQFRPDVREDVYRKSPEKYANRRLEHDHPVCQVNWFDAVEYCRWLNQQAGIPEPETCYVSELPDSSEQGAETSDAPPPFRINPNGYGFRLLTDSEWEIACRGGMQTRFAFGSDRWVLFDYGCFRRNSGATAGKLQGNFHHVGEHRPNLYGIFDMHGNVHEWCHEDFLVSPDGERMANPADTDPRGLRLHRGGCWQDEPELCDLRRAVQRVEPTTKDFTIGFRVAYVPGPWDGVPPGPSADLSGQNATSEGNRVEMAADAAE